MVANIIQTDDFSIIFIKNKLFALSPCYAIMSWIKSRKSTLKNDCGLVRLSLVFVVVLYRSPQGEKYDWVKERENERMNKGKEKLILKVWSSLLEILMS